MIPTPCLILPCWVWQLSIKKIFYFLNYIKDMGREGEWGEGKTDKLAVRQAKTENSNKENTLRDTAEPMTNLNGYAMAWFKWEIWSFEWRHCTVPSLPKLAPRHSAPLPAVNCVAHKAPPPESSLDWLSATSQNNHYRVLVQRQCW